jgi:cytochrome c oxidase assembly protein subunit 15
MFGSAILLIGATWQLLIARNPIDKDPATKKADPLREPA